MGDACNVGWSLELPDSSSIYDHLVVFYKGFYAIYLYMAASLCICGVILNLLMISVLTQRAMINTVNLLLTAIAVADLGVMLSSLIYLFKERQIHSLSCLFFPEYITWHWNAYFLFHLHFTVVCHGASLWLTVSVAAIRYIYLSMGTKLHGRDLLTPRNTLLLVMTELALILIIQLPNLMSFQIMNRSIVDLCNVNMSTVHKYSISNETEFYMLGPTPFSTQHDCMVYRIVFWINGVLFKLLPCLLMCIFIFILVRLLRTVRQRRERLSSSKNTSGEHTTAMLVLVLIIFLVTELPQGVLALLMGLYGTKFQMLVYRRLGDFLDFLSLLNSAANFIIYCAMSKKFRQIFCDMFMPNFVNGLTRTINSRNVPVPGTRKHQLREETSQLL